MKCRISQAHLHRGLSLVSHAVPPKALLPFQSCLLATLEAGRLRLSAVKEDLGIHCWVATEHIDEAGTTLLPASLLATYVSHLPAASVTITAPSPALPTACQVHCGQSHAEMTRVVMDVDEFPHIATFAEGGEPLLLLESVLLKQLIEQVCYAASKDESRPALTGMQIDIRDGKAQFVAADAFRLAMRTIALPDSDLRCSLLVSARTMSDLAKILPYEGTVRLLLTPERHHLLFHLESCDLSVPLLDAVYPQFQAVFPPSYQTRIVLKTQELLAALKLMLPFAQAGDKGLHLTCRGEDSAPETLEQHSHTLHLELVTREIGKNEQVMSARVEGPSQRISCNIHYLLDALSVIDTAEVALELVQPHRPLILKPLGPIDAVAVMMPMSEPATAAPRSHTPVPTAQAAAVAAVATH